MAKQKFDLDKFATVAARARDLYKSHREDVERGQFVRVHASIFEEMAWLADELEKHVGLVPEAV